MATVENLGSAFAGESQANRRYLAFAKQADQDGLPNVARLFRAAAEAETVHALAELKMAGGIGKTAANLEAAVAGEAFEFQEMYPQFAAEATAEKNQPAAESFRRTQQAERIHHQLYTAALETVRAGRDLPGGSIFVCSVCGHTVIGQPEETCPICGAARSRYVEVK